MSQSLVVSPIFILSFLTCLLLPPLLLLYVLFVHVFALLLARLMLMLFMIVMLHLLLIAPNMLMGVMLLHFLCALYLVLHL